MNELEVLPRIKELSKKLKNKLDRNQSKIVRDVYIPEHITVKELANRMTEKSEI